MCFLPAQKPLLFIWQDLCAEMRILMNFLKKMCKKYGQTMIIVTHEIEFARKVADRVIFMDGGVIVEQGKPEDVIDNPSNERTKAFLQKMEK